MFDLDPGRDDLPVLRAMTLATGDFLAGLGLKSWVKTTGSKGFHVVVPLDGKANFGEVSAFAHRVGALLVKRHPEELTQEFAKQDRGGRILMDTGRNEYSATFAAAYTVRARKGAPVSAPCTWREIEQGTVDPQSFTLRGMKARIDQAGELWAALPASGQSLKGAIEKLRSE